MHCYPFIICILEVWIEIPIVLWHPPWDTRHKNSRKLMIYDTRMTIQHPIVWSSQKQWVITIIMLKEIRDIHHHYLGVTPLELWPCRKIMNYLKDQEIIFLGFTVMELNIQMTIFLHSQHLESCCTWHMKTS